MKSLLTAQQNFVVTEPSLPDNPIVFASNGFLKLTGYTSKQVVGRNCRFLQGPDTDKRTVATIRRAIERGEDASVRLLNYRADGTPFWNQFFIAALRNDESVVVNYVGAQCVVPGPLPPHRGPEAAAPEAATLGSVDASSSPDASSSSESTNASADAGAGAGGQAPGEASSGTAENNGGGGGGGGGGGSRSATSLGERGVENESTRVRRGDGREWGGGGGGAGSGDDGGEDEWHRCIAAADAAAAAAADTGGGAKGESSSSGTCDGIQDSATATADTIAGATAVRLTGGFDFL
ncbi:unnamed protein product [Pylaiella littoralis]